MNNNEKAAIAGRVWGPRRKCNGIPYCNAGSSHFDNSMRHVIPAPDMHDPANLWRALENRRLVIYADTIYWSVGLVVPSLGLPLARHEKLADAVFAALVALYNVEHPE